MKSLTAIAFAALTLLAACAPATPVTVDPNDPYIQYSGRINFSDSLSPRMVFPGTTIRATFTGTSITMNMKPGSGYFMVSVDGEEPHKIHYNDTIGEIAIAQGLQQGEHTIEAMLATEQYEAQAEFRGFTLAPEAALVDMGEDTRHRIEFIGNSMTCGYGTEANEPTIKYAPSNSNFYYTYAAITARTLNLRATVVARSGIGVYRNYDGNPDGDENIMPQWYDYTLIYDDSQLWDTAGNQPEVLCINLGTNDFSTTGYKPELYQSNYDKFVRHLRGLYPDTKIVMLSGCMLNGTQLKQQQTALDAIYETLRTEGDENLYRFNFTPQDGSLGYGADWHPSQAQHQKMADELVPFLRSITGWK